MLNSACAVMLPGIEERAAHDDDAAQQLRQRRLDVERDRQIGQRPDADQRQLARPLVGQPDDRGRSAVARSQRFARSGKLGAPEPVRSPWKCAASCVRPHERPAGAAVDRHRRPRPTKSAPPACSSVVRCDVDVAGHRRRPPTSSISRRWTASASASGIVDPGVDVEDERHALVAVIAPLRSAADAPRPRPPSRPRPAASP